MHRSEFILYAKYPVSWDEVCAQSCAGQGWFCPHCCDSSRRRKQEGWRNMLKRDELWLDTYLHHQKEKEEGKCVRVSQQQTVPWTWVQNYPEGANVCLLMLQNTDEGRLKRIVEACFLFSCQGLVSVETSEHAWSHGFIATVRYSSGFSDLTQLNRQCGRYLCCWNKHNPDHLINLSVSW